MIFNNSGGSGRLCVFDVFKKPEMNVFLIDTYICSPFLRDFAPPDPANAGCVGFYSPNIHHILRLGRFTEVTKPIVGGVPVNVVYHVFRPLPRHQRPCNSMGLVKPSPDANQNPPIRRLASSNVANFHSFAGSDFPKQKSCFRVVIQHVTQLVRCYHG